jgi:hypothetical protein
MSAGWIAVVVAASAVVASAAGGRLLYARRARAARRGPATVQRLHSTTGVDPDTGSVTSVQRADVTITREALEQIWTPTHLERLARTYWRFLTRVTLGVIRVRYSDRERYVVLLAPPLRLLTFHAPEYEMDGRRGVVRWRIARGLLVARRGRGRGYLQIEVRRDDDRAVAPAAAADGGHVPLHVEVEVANFYPAIASGLSLRLYNATQSRIHVIVTYGFLRSLARLDLAESRVGRFPSQPAL